MIRTRDLRHVKAPFLKSEQGESPDSKYQIIESDQFSEPRINSENIGIESLQDFYQQHRDQIIQWLNKTVKSDTAGQYISAVDRLLDDEDFIRIPKDLEEIEIIGKADRGLRAVYNYVEKEMDQDLILGEPLSKWRRYTPIKASGVIEVYPSDQEMREAYTSIPASHRPLFLMLMYTGNRLSQTADVIAAFDPDEITYTGPNQEIAHISAAAQARGTKKAYRLFFPAAFVPDLIKYKGSPASREGYHTLANRIKHGRISAKTIRKWHLNFMIENGVSESIADYIQGRTAATVGSAHYLNKIKGAVEAYLTLIDKFPVTYKTPIKEAPAPPPAPVITLAVVSPVLCRSL